MSTVTGYADTFGRTVSNGLGTATSGQTYSLFGAAAQFSVGSNVATIAPTTGGDKIGYVDNLTSDVDITGQVALTAIPSTNQATVGFAAKMSGTTNYYVGSMYVATGGAISLRFSKVISGGLVTLATIATGLTYVANTFYNLRFSIRWSQATQTNVLQSKLWALSATQPGGWMATTTDNALTGYTGGTFVGLHTRDESTVVGSVAAKFANVATLTYSLPVPASTDPMCYDPAVTYPKQAALESLADAADVVAASLEPLVSLAGLFPRVRVSNTTYAMNTASVFVSINWSALEFNIGTPTNLAYDTSGIYVGVGIWLVTFEMKLSEATSDYILVQLNNNGVAQDVAVDMRSNPSQNSDDGTGGTCHATMLVYCTDPANPVKCTVSLSPNNTSTTYTATYMALSAIKISDYFA